MMRTQACPASPAMKGTTASATATSATPIHALVGIDLLCDLMRRLAFRRDHAPSGAIRDAFTEQSRRAKDEHEDEHEEGEHVLVVASEQADLAIAGGALL